MEIRGQVYQCQGIYDEDFAQNGQNGAAYVVVVPDAVAEQMD